MAQLDPSPRVSKWLTAALALSLCAGAGPVAGAPGDVADVQGDIVNVRAGPGIEYPVVQKLAAGHRLVEFRRDGEWVEIGADLGGDRFGWMHASLLDAQPAEVAEPPKAASVGGPALERFRATLVRLNRKIRSNTGVDFFTGVRQVDDRAIEITASDPWLNAPRKDRESSLLMLFALWDQAHGGGSITVYVADERGYQRMVMRR